MITKPQKQAVKHIMSEPGWDAMMFMVDEFIKKWNEDEVKADTEFETVWRTAQREAKGRALKEFFKELEENVN